MATQLYIAGKISKESSFGKHHWRDEFCAKLQELNGMQLTHLDPLADEKGIQTSRDIFKKDCELIAKCDVFVIFLSNDISVGGSQEILVARYFNKPVIAYAPYGGKFNNATREMFGKVVTDYKDPFVFSTCNKVCGTIEEVAEELKSYKSIQLESLDELLNFSEQPS